jgi:hypothetical protein
MSDLSTVLGQPLDAPPCFAAVEKFSMKRWNKVIRHWYECPHGGRSVKYCVGPECELFGRKREAEYKQSTK